MKKSMLALLAIISINMYANDGAFYFKGNQLVPTSETDITVRKEILSLKKVRNQFIEVTVYYEFYNPGDEKEMIVGFEAFQPEGDVSGRPKNGKHPYMRDFTVELNEDILSYQVAYVEDSAYAKNGVIKGKKVSDFESTFDFFYVYHFTAKFKKGLNIIKHTYNYDVSGSVVNDYFFEYVLTAANRWGNNQVDDFTLIIDNGEFETFNIQKSFFKKNSDWLINGIGKMKDTTHYDNDATNFNIQKGTIIFQKKNFKPSGELFVYADRYRPYAIPNTEPLPFSYYSQDDIPEPTNDFEKKVLRNLPFARRGYVFKDIKLKTHFEKLVWYIPNPNYMPDINILRKLEQDWIKKFE